MANRILIVQYSASLDGSTVSALMLADGLREAGWETHVAFGHEGPMIERFRDSGHSASVVSHKNWLRANRHGKFVRDVYREVQTVEVFEQKLRLLRPDLVYVNTCASLAGAAAAHRYQIPCVWHLRELFVDVGGEMKVPGGAKPWVRSRFFRYADRLIANSTSVARNLLGVTSYHRALVVPNGVENRFFRHGMTREVARGLFGLPLEDVVIGIPGTLRPMKGHPFFFRAVQTLLKEDSTLKVAVTGGGESSYIEQVRAQVRALGIEQQVIFLGSIDDMPAFYRACDLVCVPSVAEPFGRIIVEAFASGTPVLATRVGGIPEIIDDGVNGLLVSYGDEHALTARLCELLQNEPLRKQLSARALEKAKREYHEATYKARICQVVEELINRPAARDHGRAEVLVS